PKQPPAHTKIVSCYNCHRVLPDGATVCPYCQHEQSVRCASCGETTSKRYHTCAHCGATLVYRERRRRRSRRQRRPVLVRAAIIVGVAVALGYVVGYVIQLLSPSPAATATATTGADATAAAAPN